MRIERQALQDLVTDLAFAIDEGQSARIPQFFTEDTLYFVVARREFELGRKVGFMRCESRGMLEDRLAAMEKGNIWEPHQYRHVLGAPLVESATDTLVRMRTAFILVRTSQEGAHDIFAAGKYLDTVVKIGDRLLFRERIAVLDSHRIDTLLVIPI